MTDALTPNFDERPENAVVDLLVMHYTGMQSGEEAISWMCDPASKVSSHYVVHENGEIVALVPEKSRAWHAGISCWRGISALNDTSIGIEIVNPGHEFGYTEFPEAQMESIIQLAKQICDRHNILARNVVGHSDIAPSRKQDPGELFNWQYLAAHGVGLWPKTRKTWRPDETILEPNAENEDVGKVQTMLAQYGYHIRVDNYYGKKMENVIRAFKRHFVPEQLNVTWDKLANVRLLKLLELI